MYLQSHVENLPVQSMNFEQGNEHEDRLSKCAAAGNIRIFNCSCTSVADTSSKLPGRGSFLRV